MYPIRNDEEARDGVPAGKAESAPVLLLQGAFPRADVPPRAVFSPPGCSSRQESRYGTATTVLPNVTVTTNAAMPPWTSSTSTTSSVIGRLRSSARAVGEDMISTTEQNTIRDHELKGFLFSEFSSQQKSSTTTHACMRAADHSGFTNTIFPATVNQKSCSGSQKGFHPCRGFLINGGENSETKLHDIGSSNWNHAESRGLIQEPPPPLTPQTASSRLYNYDTGGVVLQSRIETATSSTFLHQGSPIQTAAVTCINPVSNMELLQGMEAATDDNNETHILMCPQDKSTINMPRSSTDHHDNHSCPNYNYDHKGKSTALEYCLWDSNWSSSTAEQHDHLTDYHFGEDKSADSAVISTNQLLKFFSSCPADQYAVGCQHVGSYPYPCFDVKELEEREWTKLLQKELTNSDVGTLGRIVLPKKEAEANLPPLLEKEGLLLEMVDMANHVVWGFKYRFWPNNRSRMYILENTGDFAKMNKLEIGDSLIIYGDGTSRYYLVGVQKRR